MSTASSRTDDEICPSIEGLAILPGEGLEGSCSVRDFEFMEDIEDSKGLVCV